MDLWLFLQGHPFERALAVGLLAGMAPLQIWLSASGLMNRKIRLYLLRLKLDRLKPWIAVFYSPILLLALVHWTVQWFENRSRFASVLLTDSPYPFSDFFRGFLTTDCSRGGSWAAMFWGDNYGLGCMIHVQLITAWLLAAGYSLAPFVRKRVMDLSGDKKLEPLDSEPARNIEESTMAEKTDTK